MSTYLKKWDPKFKARFLEAMRTPPDEGGYCQTQGTLFSECDARLWIDGVGQREGFCCLGVITDMAVIDGVLPNGWDKPVTTHSSLTPAEMVMPHTAVNKHYGLTKVTNATLSKMNDDGDTFLEIADWVEHNL